LQLAGTAVITLTTGYRPSIEVAGSPDGYGRVFCHVTVTDYLTKAKAGVAGHITEGIASNPGSDDPSDLFGQLEMNFLLGKFDYKYAWEALEAHFELQPDEDDNGLLTAERAAAWTWLLLRTARVLKAHWPLVELIAAEVLAKGNVSAARIQELATSLPQ